MFNLVGTETPFEFFKRCFFASGFLLDAFNDGALANSMILTTRKPL